LESMCATLWRTGGEPPYCTSPAGLLPAGLVIVRDRRLPDRCHCRLMRRRQGRAHCLLPVGNGPQGDSSVSVWVARPSRLPIFKPLYSVLARLIGYDGSAIADARDKALELAKLYGKDNVPAA